LAISDTPSQPDLLSLAATGVKAYDVLSLCRRQSHCGCLRDRCV